MLAAAAGRREMASCLERFIGDLPAKAAKKEDEDDDTNDDGALDLPANAVVVDAIATTDGGSTDSASASQ